MCDALIVPGVETDSLAQVTDGEGKLEHLAVWCVVEALPVSSYQPKAKSPAQFIESMHTSNDTVNEPPLHCSGTVPYSLVLSYMIAR